MKVGIIGCGNIGMKRAAIIAQSSDDQLIGLVEVNHSRWPRLQQEFGCPVSDSPDLILKESDAVIVATPPQQHVALVEKALEAGKDVLCEKPLAESLEEVKKLTHLADKNQKVLKCGFNLRHDKGLERAKLLYDEGLIGTPYFLKAHYVNGCVLVNTNRVGSLLDMGSHLLDLILWFGEEPEEIKGILQRAEYLLDCDDNGFLILKTKNFAVQIHFSFIRWRNHFQLEISGDKGALEVINLPKWGKQELRIYRRTFPSGVPEMITEIFEGDSSWEREWQYFHNLCQKRDLSENNGALQVMKLIETIQSTLPLTVKKKYQENL